MFLHAMMPFGIVKKQYMPMSPGSRGTKTGMQGSECYTSLDVRKQGCKDVDARLGTQSLLAFIEGLRATYRKCYKSWKHVFPLPFTVSL